LGGSEGGKEATGELTVSVRAYADPVIHIIEGLKYVVVVIVVV
jgi:hypothetical protein